MGFDRKFLVWALAYVAIGMSLGIYMAASHYHGQHITHAHILLVGFVVSFIYAVIHKLWLGETATPRLARVQFIAHQSGAVMMSSGLFLLYGGFVPEAQIERLLAPSTLIVFAAALMMIVMVVKARR
jgi:membrane protein DedA with SNARE-associated domain